MDKKKNERLSEIFDVLDSDGDGLISSQKIDISALTPEVLEIFTPLFCEMEELAQTLDLEEFVDASKRLLDTLTIPERDLILATGEKWEIKAAQNKEEFSFQPNLNKNSRRIAQHTRDSGDIAS